MGSLSHLGSLFIVSEAIRISGMIPRKCVWCVSCVASVQIVCVIAVQYGNMLNLSHWNCLSLFGKHA